MFCVAVFCFFFFLFQKNICLNKLMHPFWLPVSSSHLISVPPNWQRHATKKVRSFIPCHFIIFGERSDPPSVISVQRPGNLPRARIKNSQRPPQNTRDKGNLIFHSYSKTDVRAPFAHAWWQDEEVVYRSKALLRVYKSLNQSDNNHNTWRVRLQSPAYHGTVWSPKRKQHPELCFSNKFEHEEEDVRNIRFVEQQVDRNNHCGNLFGWP